MYLFYVIPCTDNDLSVVITQQMHSLCIYTGICIIYTHTHTLTHIAVGTQLVSFMKFLHNKSCLRKMITLI